MPGRRTSLREVALAGELVESEGLSLRDAGARTGLHHSTIGRMLQGDHGWGEIQETPVFKRHRATQNKALESAFRAGAAMSLQEAYKPAKLKKASHYQLVMSAAIATDKARLLGGESTENVEVHHHAEEIERAADLIAASLMRFSVPTASVVGSNDLDPGYLSIPSQTPLESKLGAKEGE